MVRQSVLGVLLFGVCVAAVASYVDNTSNFVASNSNKSIYYETMEVVQQASQSSEEGVLKSGSSTSVSGGALVNDTAKDSVSLKTTSSAAFDFKVSLTTACAIVFEFTPENIVNAKFDVFVNAPGTTGTPSALSAYSVLQNTPRKIYFTGDAAKVGTYNVLVCNKGTVDAKIKVKATH